MAAQPTLVRDGATILTGSFVYSSQVAIDAYNHHTLLIEYANTTDSTNALEVVVQVSYDEIGTAAASSDWINIGTMSNSSGTLTFTASTLSMASGAANTYAQWDLGDDLTLAKKIRVGVRETNTPATFGFATIWLFSDHT